MIEMLMDPSQNAGIVHHNDVPKGRLMRIVRGRWVSDSELSQAVGRVVTGPLHDVLFAIRIALDPEAKKGLLDGRIHALSGVKNGKK